MSNFPLQYHLQITHKGTENNKYDHQQKKLLMVKQILVVIAQGKV